MKKILLSFIVFVLCLGFKMNAQEQKTPDWKRWHYLSEEEMNTPVRNENFVETPPPTGTPRFVAEFEPMQGVMIRYPLGIPTSLVAQMSNNCHIYCIAESYYQSSAQSTFQGAGVNMNNVTFVTAETDSYWVRDYGPWYIFEDKHPAIVDNRYNRPRPYDDEISGVFATFWGIPMYGMNLEHTGGNMMEDGRGHGVSDNLVVQENNNNETNVRNKMRDYLGIDPYHITIDPQGDYIAHVDCWGKYLAPDKILIAQLPSSNSHAADYDSVAAYFARTNCCWGYPYHVYRVQEPGGSTLAPYTNSLILNKSVYVPLGSNSNYNQQALAVYQEALPGYEIVGINSGSAGWYNTDALHCRTRGVMDFNMLFVDHRDVYHGEEEWQAEYPVVSKFIAYSDEPLKADSLLVYYSINGGAYQVAHMIATGEPDEYVGNITGFQGGDEIDYYVFGADESNHRYTQPVFAELEPHHFTVGPHSPSGELVITPSTLWFEVGNQQSFSIINETTGNVVINSIECEDGYLHILTPGGLPTTLAAGASLNVDVMFLVPPTKDFIERTITISTSVGDRTVTAMINSELEDWGLWIPGAPYVELTVNEPQAYPYVVNGNYGSNTPIVITEVYELTNTAHPNVQYLEIEYPELPYTLGVTQNFELTVRVNPNLSRDIKDYVETAICIVSDQNNVTYYVTIDGELLSINEVSVETKVYPNPMSNVLHIESNNVQDVTIFNAVGQQVLFVENTNEIDVESLSEGLYFVKISDMKGNSIVKKIVKR